MASVMTKRGQQDNEITYEHICDKPADMSKIDPAYITLGSICIVLEGDGGLEAYMANSKKKWISILGSSDEEEAEETGGGD